MRSLYNRLCSQCRNLSCHWFLSYRRMKSTWSQQSPRYQCVGIFSFFHYLCEVGNATQLPDTHRCVLFHLLRQVEFLTLAPRHEGVRPDDLGQLAIHLPHSIPELQPGILLTVPAIFIAQDTKEAWHLLPSTSGISRSCPAHVWTVGLCMLMNLVQGSASSAVI